MSIFEIENQGSNTYLVYKLKKTDVIDKLSLGMISNNKIDGIMPIVYEQLDEDIYFKYNISSRVTVKEFFNGPVNKKRLLGVFSSVLNAVMQAEEYMIKIESLCFDVENIYVDVTTCNAEMICLPIISNQSESANVGMFFKQIMFSTQFDQTENSNHITAIMNYLNSTPNFLPADFKNVIDSLGIQNQGSQGNASINNQAAIPQVSNQNVIPQGNVQASIPQGNATTVIPQQSVPKQETVSPAKNTVKNEQNSKVQVPKSNGGFEIPGQKAVPKQENAENVAQSDEKEISLFYLMQHYNSENAAKYKEQKAKKKAMAASGSVPEAKSSKKNKKNAPSAEGFTVPGASGNTGFDVPGQSSVQSSIPTQSNVGGAVNSIPSPQPVISGGAGNSFIPNAVGSVNADFGDTVVLNQNEGAGETTVLNASELNAMSNAYLVRMKNNERIFINKDLFILGKERSMVDYFIGDNTAVSRSHANIVKRNDSYFIVDNGSTNHTYVDNQVITANTEVKIEHGTKIRLANESFEFRLY